MKFFAVLNWAVNCWACRVEQAAVLDEVDTPQKAQHSATGNHRAEEVKNMSAGHDKRSGAEQRVQTPVQSSTGGWGSAIADDCRDSDLKSNVSKRACVGTPRCQYSPTA